MRFGVQLCIIMVLISVLVLTVSTQSHRKPSNQTQAQAQDRLLTRRRRANYDVLKPRYATLPQTHRLKDMEAVMDRLMHDILKPSVFVKQRKTGV
jgi:hypothetical protein